MRLLTLIRLSLAICCATFFLVGSVIAQDETAEESVSPLDESGKLVQFDRDIAPILSARCLECHGPKDAKNDFRVDERDLMMDYIEPEDVESSSLFVDYLTIDDEDMLMPPKSHRGPLSPSELALIRVWIAEGADWPEDYQFPEAAEEVIPPVTTTVPLTWSERAWSALGFLHPATVHFPIALFVLGGGFVILGWKWPSIGTQIPLACLFLGTLSAVLSAAMGWSFTPERGYGVGWNILDWDREIDVHRWSGAILTIASSIFSIIALMALWKDSDSLKNCWKIGLLVCAGMVGAVGHQGGELNYGEDFYPRAWRILNGEPEPDEVPVVAITEIESVTVAYEEGPSETVSDDETVSDEDKGTSGETAPDADKPANADTDTAESS